MVPSKNTALRTSLLLLCFFAALMVRPAPLRAQAADGKKAKGDAPKRLSPEYASPRDTVETFLQNIEKLREQKLKRETEDPEAWDKVFQALDKPSGAAGLREDLAWHLLGVFRGLHGRESTDAGAFAQRFASMALGSDEIKDEKSYEFLPGSENTAARNLFQRAIDELGPPPPNLTITLEKTDSGWKFSGATLDGIKDLFNWIESRARSAGFDIGTFSAAAKIRRGMPKWLRPEFLTLELWQWLGLFLLILVALAADLLARIIVRPLVRRIVKRHIAEPPPGMVRLAVRPTGVIVGALVFLALLGLLDLPGSPATVLAVAAKLLLIVGTVWAAWSLTDLISKALLQRAATTESTFDDMLIPLVRKSIKLFVVAVGLIYVAESLNIALGPLLASFGLAGLAVTFAAQDTVKNLFGGLAIFLDRPFKIGDRIIFKGFDGIIEEIGFRTTRLRTLTGHLVTLPNAGFTSEPVENPARRPTIRRIMNLTITYDTPLEKIRQAVQIVRDILEEDGIREPIHPVINGGELPPRVYFNNFNADSLNIFVIYWFSPPAWWDYNDHAEKLNLRILEEFEKAGIEFAFPTQTLYLAGDPKRELAFKMLDGDGEPLELGATPERRAPSRGGRAKRTKGK